MGKNQTTGKYICIDGAQPSAGIQNGKPDKNCAEPSPRTEKEQTLWESVQDSYTRGATMDAKASEGVPDMAYGMGKEVATGAAEQVVGTLDAIHTGITNPAQGIANTITGYVDSAVKLWNTVSDPGAAWNAYREQIAQRAAAGGAEGAGGAIASPLMAIAGMVLPKKGAKRVHPHEEHPHRMPDAPPPDPKRGSGFKVIKRKLMDVGCFKAGDRIPAAKHAEFDRQLAGQEKGLNDMTVKEYLEGRDRFNDIGRGSASEQKNARTKYSLELTEQFEKQLDEYGIVGHEGAKRAAQMAKERMSTLAALHNPDMIAGGKNAIADFGDRGVNSSIGSSWKNKIGDLDAHAKEVPKSERSSIKMNTKLERCK